MSVADRVCALLTILLSAQVAAAPLPVDQVAPGVYVHFGQHKDIDEGYDGDIANIGFIVGSEAVAVIDTGGSYAVGLALHEALRAITPLPVRYVINTHGHPDHVFGNAAFVQPDAAGHAPQWIGHARLQRALAARRKNATSDATSDATHNATDHALPAPERTVQERLRLELGGRTLELVAWPRAHTDHDLTVFDSASATLFSGDLLFIERTPAIDGSGTIEGWLAVSDALKKLPARVVIPGHGPVTRDQQWALDRQAAYLATLLRDVRASIGRGDSMTAAMHTAAASERGRWQLFDVVNRRNVNLLFPLLEWE